MFTDKTKHDKIDESNTIKITCNKDFKEDQDLNFYAYPKGKTSKADRRLIGRIRLGANSAKVHKEIKTLLIPVKTNITNTSDDKGEKTGKITNQSDEYLTRILNQAFITPKVETYCITDPATCASQDFLDLSTDPDFQTGGKHIDKLYPKIRRKEGFRRINNKLVPDLETKFFSIKDATGALINEKYRDYFLIFIFGEDSNWNGLYGFSKDINEKSVVLFEINNTSPIIGVLSHEFLHGLGLYHTHKEPTTNLSEEQKRLLKNKRYTHLNLATDNVMSYNTRLTNVWHWQAKIVNPNIK